MGELYRLRRKIEQIIKDGNLDEHQTKGKITLECGLLLALINENTPDEVNALRKLKTAAEKLLGNF
jgi:hypothetical protein